MRALLVEDDAAIAEFVVRGLREAGFAVDHAADGEAGLTSALERPYDVAIVDLMLPKRDGLSLIDELRRRGVTTPVLILSARRSVDDLTLDLLSRRVSRGGKPLDLRPREFALLEYLMRNPGRVVSKTMILSHVWDYNFDPQTNVVDVLVSRLREKIDRPFDKKLLHTVRGVGYVLR